MADQKPPDRPKIAIPGAGRVLIPRDITMHIVYNTASGRLGFASSETIELPLLVALFSEIMLRAVQEGLAGQVPPAPPKQPAG